MSDAQFVEDLDAVVKRRWASIREGAFWRHVIENGMDGDLPAPASHPEVLRIAGCVRLPVGCEVALGDAGVDRARGRARGAVDALARIDV